MEIKKFEHFNIGDVAKLEHTITEDDVRKFVELTGDDNPLHVNKAFAKNTVFKDTVVHGMLGASFVSTLVGKHIPGNGALWISQNFDFLVPVRVGDTLSIQSKIIDKNLSQQILVLETQTINQHKQVVMQGTGKVKCLQMLASDKPIELAENEKVVLLIGASRGIGAATAEYLAKLGYKVIVNYANDKLGAETTVAEIRQKGGDAVAYQADVRDINAVNKMIDYVIHHFGSLTGLVYGASTKVVASDFLALEWQDIENHFDVQLRGAFYCVQRALKEFIKQKRGSVVFIGSISADATPLLKVAGYTASKAALHSFAKSLALEYGPLGIRFNVVSPGMTETALIADIPEKTRLLMKMQTPLRRLAIPIDIASAIEFLLSDNAKHITGETLRINGGQLMI